MSEFNAQSAGDTSLTAKHLYTWASTFNWTCGVIRKTTSVNPCKSVAGGFEEPHMNSTFSQ